MSEKSEFIVWDTQHVDRSPVRLWALGPETAARIYALQCVDLLTVSRLGSDAFKMTVGVAEAKKCSCARRFEVRVEVDSDPVREKASKYDERG